MEKIMLEVNVGPSSDNIKGTRFEEALDVKWESNIYSLMNDLVYSVYTIYSMHNETKLTTGGNNKELKLFYYKDGISLGGYSEEVKSILWDSIIEKFQPKFMQYLGNSTECLEGKIFFKGSDDLTFINGVSRYLYQTFEEVENELDTVKTTASIPELMSKIDKLVGILNSQNNEENTEKKEEEQIVEHEVVEQENVEQVSARKLGSDNFKLCECFHVSDVINHIDVPDEPSLEFEVGKQYKYFEDANGGGHTVYLHSDDWVPGKNGKITESGRLNICFFYGSQFSDHFKPVE